MADVGLEVWPLLLGPSPSVFVAPGIILLPTHNVEVNINAICVKNKKTSL